MASGEITEDDIKASRILYEVDREYRIGGELIAAADMGGYFLLLIRGEVGRFIGRKGKVLRRLKELFGKPVRVVEADADVKKVVQDILGPVRVIGVSYVESPNGDFYRVYILRSDASRLPFAYHSIKKGLEFALSSPVEIVFV